MKPTSEFNNFDRTMRELLKVPHAEIKRKLDEEKSLKKRKKSKKSSASGRGEPSWASFASYPPCQSLRHR